VLWPLIAVRKLRVGVDGRAFASPAAGIRRYTSGLVRALLALNEPLEVVALGGPDSSDIPAGVGHIAEPPHPATNVGWTLIGLPRAARRARVDLIHAPAYTGPWWAPVPVVVTVHDVSYELHPQWYPYRRDPLRRFYYRRSARAASHILTVSRFSAGEIAAAYRISPDRITVTPLGVDEGFEPGETIDLPAAVVPPYVLHVGDLHERRNLALLVEAVVRARRHFGAASSLSLVLVGVDLGICDGLRLLAARGGVPDAVVHLGTVSETHLRSLYRAAAALVYPSLYEGFGLPLIEAMRSGTPVIASNAASVPEVVGDAGRLLDPLDGPRWTEAIVDVVNNDELRGRMRASGLRRAVEFTWDRTARLTLDAYRRAA
jgi:glycosyltransferase involved in cell wall biosynthesis